MKWEKLDTIVMLAILLILASIMLFITEGRRQDLEIRVRVAEALYEQHQEWTEPQLEEPRPLVDPNEFRCQVGEDLRHASVDITWQEAEPEMAEGE